jgi:hypothetical protein
MIPGLDPKKRKGKKKRGHSEKEKKKKRKEKGKRKGDIHVFCLGKEKGTFMFFACVRWLAAAVSLSKCHAAHAPLLATITPATKFRTNAVAGVAARGIE